MQRHSTADDRQPEFRTRHSSLVTRHSAFCIAAFAALAASAVPKVVHVAPDGTGDGSSWANAAGSLFAAYADAAAFAESGCDSGEVWMKAGTYVLTEAIPLMSGVAVRGGFAGTETSADAADPAANQTIVSGDVSGNNKWYVVGGSGLSGTPMWQDGVFTEPNPDGRDDYWHGNNSTCLANETTNAFVLAESGPLSGAAFTGITFTGFKSFVFFLGSGVAGGAISFSDCKFLGVSIGGQTSGSPQSGATLKTYGAAILSSNVAVRATSCDFVGTTRPVYLHFFASHETGVENTFSNCSFRANRYHCFFYGVTTAAKQTGHKLTVVDCLFDRNYSQDYSYGGAVLKIDIPENVGPTATFRDCKATRNIMKGGAGGLFYLKSTGMVTIFERCRFSDNVAREGKDNWISPIVYSYAGNCLIRDCHFVGNIVSNTVTASGSKVSASAIYHYKGSCDVINCTFEGNRNVGVSASVSCLSTINLTDYAHFALANCSFVDNVFEGQYKKAAEILFKTGSSSTVGIANTVFENSAADYSTFLGVSSSITIKGMAVCNSVIPDYGLSLTNKFPVFSDRGGITTSGAPLAARGRRKGDLLYGRGVSPYAPLLWNGIEVKISSRRIYAYQPKVNASSPWNRIGEDTQVKSISSAPVPDVFGTKRRAGRIAYGPVQPDTVTRLAVR